MPRSTTLFIAACWAVASPAALAAVPADTAGGSGRCLSCHPSAAGVLAGAMATRTSERAFARRAFGADGDRFFVESCAGCHVTGCSDCHEDQPHGARRPGDGACLRCHRGYSAGWEYQGKAVREDHQRYRRGPASQGEPYLTMLPDVHRERGMACADCHPMASLHAGRRGAKACRDCHPSVSRASPEHAIAGHLKKMACVACHAAWASQEYGTFLVRSPEDGPEDAFAALPRHGPWRKSAQLRRQDAPPLGLDANGLVTPIRPRFVLFATDPRRGWENRLLAAEWSAFTPHTVRPGTVACSGCHDSPRRFVLEPDADRLYLLELDGLPLRSYWSREGQRVVNGSFLPADRYQRMNRKTPEYARKVVERWKIMLDRAAPRSGR